MSNTAELKINGAAAYFSTAFPRVTSAPENRALHPFYMQHFGIVHTFSPLKASAVCEADFTSAPTQRKNLFSLMSEINASNLIRV